MLRLGWIVAAIAVAAAIAWLALAGYPEPSIEPPASQQAERRPERAQPDPPARNAEPSVEAPAEAAAETVSRIEEAAGSQPPAMPPLVMPPPEPPPTQIAAAPVRAPAVPPRDRSVIPPAPDPPEDAAEAKPPAPPSSVPPQEQAQAAEQAPPEQGEIRLVRGESLRMRAEPNSTGEVLAVLSQGEELQVDRTEGDWSHITTRDGRSGWMATRFLTEKDPAD